MPSFTALGAALVAAASVVSAERIAIQVGANTTANASMIFQPASVRAQAGDVVVFNCEHFSFFLLSVFAVCSLPRRSRV